MKLVLAIIVCFGLYTASANPPPEELEEDYQTFIFMAHFSEKMNSVGVRDWMKHSWNILDVANDKFKKKCVEGLKKKLKREEWGRHDKTKSNEAYDVLETHLPTLIKETFRKLIAMCRRSKCDYGIQKYGTPPKWKNFKRADKYFKLASINAFIKKCGNRKIDWNSEDIDVCNDAYLAIDEQMRPIWISLVNSDKKFIESSLCDGTFVDIVKFWFKQKNKRPYSTDGQRAGYALMSYKSSLAREKKKNKSADSKTTLKM